MAGLDEAMPTIQYRISPVFGRMHEVEGVPEETHQSKQGGTEVHETPIAAFGDAR